METLALITFSVLLLSAMWVYAKSISRKKAPPLQPGPLGFPVVGYLPFLRPNLHHHFTDRATKYGPIFKLQRGRRLVVVVNSPSIASNDLRFLPFGSGRRICAGIPLAEKKLFYILSSLLHTFDWHLPEGVNLDLSDKFGIVTKKNTLLIVVPAQRLSKSELYQ